MDYTNLIITMTHNLVHAGDIPGRKFKQQKRKSNNSDIGCQNKRFR